MAKSSLSLRHWPPSSRTGWDPLTLEASLTCEASMNRRPETLAVFRVSQWVTGSINPNHNLQCWASMFLRVYFTPMQRFLPYFPVFKCAAVMGRRRIRRNSFWKGKSGKCWNVSVSHCSQRLGKKRKTALRSTQRSADVLGWWWNPSAGTLHIKQNRRELSNKTPVWQS